MGCVLFDILTGFVTFSLLLPLVVFFPTSVYVLSSVLASVFDMAPESGAAFFLTLLSALL